MANLLIIMSDQHGAQWSGAYGHPLVQTPCIDRLASEGVLFENAYTNCPICVPSRMSFLTGRYVQDIEIWDNNTILPSSTKTWAHALDKAGYDVVLNGKMHFRGSDRLHGFRTQLSSDRSGDERTNAPVPDFARSRVPGTSMPEMKKYGVMPEDRVTQDDNTEAAAVEYIKEQAQRTNPSRPWAMFVGFAGPHPGWHVKQSFLDRYPLHEVPMPVLPEGYLESQHAVHSRNRVMHGMKADTYPDEDVRRARQAYFAKITWIDEKIGTILDALASTGQAEDTCVVYTSDHGEMAGEQGLWHKHTFYDPSARVPLIIRAPGSEKGVRRNEVVSLVDLTATILDWGDAELPEPVRGSTLMPLLNGISDGWKNEVLSEYYATWVDRPMAMLRRGRHKISQSFNEAPEVYDVEADPGEMTDLARYPANAELVRSLRTDLLNRWNPEELNKRILASQAERLAREPAAT